MKIYGLTSKDKSNIGSGVRRANRNPLGSKGAKKERRPSVRSGDTYRGYFKAINTSDEFEQKIKIVNGYDTSLTKSGYASINDIVFELDATELIITETSFIYIQSVAVLNEETDIYETQTPTFEIDSSYPTFEPLVFKNLLYVIYFEDGKIVSIVPQFYGDIIGYASGGCDL